jgi:hypothetical protein
LLATMEFANDLMAGLRGRVRAVPGGVETPGFDWFGLHARLSAGHAARSELARGESHIHGAAGSFVMWQSSVGSAAKSLPDVNQADSADGKALAGMDSLIAGESGAGDRGQE